jgi:SsrA-binding protein
MNDSFCFLREGEVCVKNMHIALYDKSDAFSTHETRRDRKILLHKREIDKIAGKINRQGYTLVPLKLYFKGSLVKIEVALCRGKHAYDKKQSLAERDQKRAVERDIKNAGF